MAWQRRLQKEMMAIRTGKQSVSPFFIVPFHILPFSVTACDSYRLITHRAPRSRWTGASIVVALPCLALLYFIANQAKRKIDCCLFSLLSSLTLA